MQHFFDVSVAKEIGINCAIILQHIAFWVEKNKADDRNKYNGMYWTRISQKGMQKYFSYLTEKQIRYAIDKLVNSGIILKAKDTSSFDRSNLYAITDYGYDLLCGKQRTKSTNALANEGESNNTKSERPSANKGESNDTKKADDIYIYNNIYNCPDNKTDSKTDNKTDNTVSEKEVLEEVSDDVLKTALIEFLAMRKKLKKTCTPHALQLIIKRLYKLSDDPAERVDIVQQSTRNSWLDVYPLKTDTAREVYSETQKAVKTSNPFILAAMRQEGKNE